MTRKFDNDEYRHSWLETHIKHFLAAQMRALRGAQRQEDFAKKLGYASQSVIARLENPAYGNMTVNTLLDIAKRLRVGLQVRFVPFSRVMDEAKNADSDELAPLAYEADMKIRDSRVSVERPMAAINPAAKPRRSRYEMPFVRLQDQVIDLPDQQPTNQSKQTLQVPHGR